MQGLTKCSEAMLSDMPMETRSMAAHLHLQAMCNGGQTPE